MTVWPARTLQSDCLALGFVFMCEAIAPHLATAQQMFRLNPSVSVTEVYDSNLFFTPSDRQGDSIWRVSPAIEPEYRSMPWTMVGRLTLDAERFAAHPELNTIQAREHAALDLRYRPAPRWTFGTVTEFSKTQTPGELNVLTAVTLARANARPGAGRARTACAAGPAPRRHRPGGSPPDPPLQRGEAPLHLHWPSLDADRKPRRPSDRGSS